MNNRNFDAMSQRFYHSYCLLLAMSALLLQGCGEAPKKTSDVDHPKTEPKSETVEIIPKAGIIQIFTNGKAIGWDEKSNCHIQFGENPSIQDARLKFRGGASSKYHKHSFSFSLKKDTLLHPNFHFDNDFILNASYIDKTFLRHRLCYDVFRNLDPNNIAANCIYQEVYLDGDYQGVYILMEEIDRSKCNLSKADSSALLIKDGIMFVADTTDFYIQPGEDAFQQKFPKKQTAQQTDRLSRLRNFIHYSTDQTFVDSVAHYFDLDNVASWHLLLLLSNNGDGVVKNFYWYTQNNGPWKVIPWDYDDSFGRNGDGTLQTRGCGWERNVLLKRLFELNSHNYKQLLIGEIQDFRKRHLNGDHLLMYITTLKATELSPQAFDRNFEKWKINDPNYSDSMNRDEEIELLQNNWHKQINYLDSLSRTWETQ